MSKIVCAAFVTLGCLLQALASAQSSTASSSLNYIPNTRVRPFPYLQSSSYALVGGAAVSIEFGFAPGEDKLLLDYQGEFDIQAKFDDKSGVLWLTGNAPTSVYMSAISSVIFFTHADDGQQRRITWNFGMSTTYASLTGHYYEFNRHLVSWSTANSTCATRKMFGLQGYLATITSADEMASVGGKVSYNTYIGGSDAGAEGVWKWTSGPEKNMQFWQGKNQFNGGKAVNNMWSQWGRFQPNNGGASTNPAENYLALQHGILGVGYLKDYAMTGVAGYLCEYGGMDSDAVAQTTAEFANSVVLHFSCKMFESSTECNNNAQYGCSFSGVSCVQLDCTTHVEEGKCMADWRCSWAVDGMIGKCGNTACGKYSNADACAADDQCTASTSAGIAMCKPATCADRQTNAASCSQISSCQFISGQCMSQDSFGCANVDTVFMLDGSANMAAPWGKVSTGFQGLVDMLRMFPWSIGSQFNGQNLGFVQYGPNSMLESSAQAAPNAGGTLRHSVVNVMADLEYMQNSFTASPGTRQISSALNTALGMFGNETNTARKKVVVIFASGAISDAAAVAAANSVPSDVTVIGIAIKPSHQVTNDGTAALASLQLLASTPALASETSLMGVMKQIKMQCWGSTTVGAAINPTGWPAVKACFSHSTKATCVPDADCGWDGASSSCKPSACNGIKGSTNCGAATSCVWSTADSRCKQLCATQTTSATCGAQSVCAWDTTTSVCMNEACIGNPTEDSCIADSAECRWKSSTTDPSTLEITAGRCELMACEAISSSGNCNGNCKWIQDKSKCIEDVCKTQTNRQTCEMDTAPTNSQCKWENSACVFNMCGLQTTEKECGDTVQCGWSVATAPGLCKPAKCTGYNLDVNTKKDNCKAKEATLDCKWSTVNGCELMTCAMLTNSSHCAQRGDCVWRGSQCKDNRFVQCPGIDIVVAVEATKMMSQTFGRHPNGFLGVIEQLREWGDELPFSNSPTASGFRIQLQLYGSKAAQTYPSSSGLYSADSTGGFSWTGPGSYLHTARDYFNTPSNLPDSTEVHLVGSLKAALTTFKNNAVDGVNRKKVMVILGHSAITPDADTDLTSAVAGLEGEGVQIFSNLLRRFSTITPAETAAAARMAPFSTDPRRTHFMFTTIDLLRPTLFDNLCNPTTTVGKALSISRDETLPCNWLSGKEECGVQGACSFDKTASIKCPLPGQCAQLGCLPMPASLAKVFDCEHCEIVNGAIKCSTGNRFPVPTGLCKTDPCMLNSSATCNNYAGCWWDTTMDKCTRKQCQYTNRTTCNADLACVYVDAGLDMPGTATKTTAGCKKSACGLIRTGTTCTTKMVQMPSGTPWNECYYNTALSPAICTESRCANSDTTNCQAGCRDEPGSNTRPCKIKLCRHATQARCEMDASCYWNPDKDGVTDLKCQERPDTCVLAAQYSSYSTCSSSCQGGVKYKVREVYSVNSPNKQSCAAEAAADKVGTAPNTKLVEAVSCYGVADQVCSTYCAGSSLNTPAACAADISCMWAQVGTATTASCVPRASDACGAITDPAACAGADGCRYDSVYKFCFPAVGACQNKTSTADSCANFPLCSWNSGAKNNMDAAMWGVPSHLVNPGQKAIVLFPTLRFESDVMLTGATVTIEGNYSRGSDVLEVSYGNVLTGAFNPGAGTLFISGSATVTEYVNALRAVTFFTTSTSKNTRIVTWSFGDRVVYSAITGHYYKAWKSNSTSYSGAVSKCNAAGEMWGKFGYLVAIDSEHENTIVSQKLDAMGWISGEDRSAGQWRLTTGPDANTPFWSGSTYAFGGRPAAGMFANWDQDSPKDSSSSFSNAYLADTGYWTTKSTTEMGGYICEFGGLTTDPGFATFQTSGVTTVSGAGCIPTPCVYHKAQTDCQRDVECMWDTDGLCKVGCAGASSAGDCARAPHCKWDSSTLPPSCALDKCQKASKTECTSASLSDTCLWGDAQGCVYRTGCALHLTDSLCSAVAQCAWTKGANAATGSFCAARPCEMFTDSKDCALNSQCEWNANAGACVSTVCKTGDENVCKADRRCTWQNGMGGVAAPFTPGGASMRPFSTGIPTTNDITNMCSGITVSIVQGFQQGSDTLFVKDEDNIASNFVIKYDRLSGVLIARTSPGVTNTRYACFQFLQTAVRFFTTSNTVNSRRLSYTLGADMVVNEKNDKLLHYVKKAALNWTAASDMCTAQATKWGFTGSRVAQIYSQVDNLRLKALTAQGWLGATVHTGTQNWYWPGQTVNFWSGAGASGKLEKTTAGVGRYAQWAAGEPKAATYSTSRAFLVSSGFWKTVAGGANTPVGVICEYDVPAVIVTSARNVAPYGCFMSACLGFGFDVCRQDPACVWKDAINGSQTAGQCALDTWCTSEKTPTNCTQRELCYWDFDLGTCRTSPSNKCSAKTTGTDCKAATGCDWKSATEMVPRLTSQDGVCIFSGCAANPAESPCTANPECRWATSALTSACVSRQCGYLSEKQCWSDSMCVWDMSVSRCHVSGCMTYGPTDPECNSANSCAKASVNNAPICGYVRCGTTMAGTDGKNKCEDDSSCLWNPSSSSCASAGCEKHIIEKDCNADKSCYFTYNPNRCLAAQCTSNTDLAECEKGEIETAKKPCIWNIDTKSCRQPTFAEQNAPATNSGVCQREEYGNLVWLWILAALILLLIIAIFYRLYLAHKHGLSFFEPAKNTKTFKQNYDDSIFEEAQKRGEDTNADDQPSGPLPTNQTRSSRPTADEL